MILYLVLDTEIRMKTLRYQVVRGHPTVAAPLLNGAVSRIKQDYKAAKFKIGITNNPELRHKHSTYAKYHAMFVLYQTDTRDHVEEMERSLIRLFWEVSGLANERGGGAGRKSQPPYYLYVAVRRKNQLLIYLDGIITKIRRL